MALENYDTWYAKVYTFTRRTIINEFNPVKEVFPGSVLGDDLGLDPEKWFALADLAQIEFDCKFANDDFVIFDRDSPTVDGFVKMTLKKLNITLPIDYEFLEIIEIVASFIEEDTGIPAAEIALGDHFIDNHNIDSMSMVHIVAKCEDEFNVKIPDNDFFELKFVYELVNYISDHRKVNTVM